MIVSDVDLIKRVLQGFGTVGWNTRDTEKWSKSKQQRPRWLKIKALNTENYISYNEKDNDKEKLLVFYQKIGEFLLNLLLS